MVTDDTTAQRYVAVRGLVPLLLKLLQCEIKAILDVEVSIVPKLKPAYSLLGIVSLLTVLVDQPALKPVLKRHDTGQRSLQNFLQLRRLITCRSNITDGCATRLLAIVKGSFADAGDNKGDIVTAFVQALELYSAGFASGDGRDVGLATPVSPLSPMHRNRNISPSVATALATEGVSGADDISTGDLRNLIYIVEQLMNVIKPPIEQPTCRLVLKKSPTQEEFIRGTMGKDPLENTEFDGPLMSHVKDKICKTLGLPDADNMLELLVNNRLVNLDLPIMRVYQKVWSPALMESIEALHHAGSGGAVDSAAIRDLLLNQHMEDEFAMGSDDSDDHSDEDQSDAMPMGSPASGSDGHAAPSGLSRRAVKEVPMMVVRMCICV